MAKESRDAIVVQIKELNKTFVAKILEVTGNDADVAAFFANKAEMEAKNEELRKQEIKAREEFRQGRDAAVDKYKEQYLNQL
jgi:hypothetical protein